MRWLLATPSVSGIFNVGTGKARSFRDMIVAMFAAHGRTPNIEYIDMPQQIRGHISISRKRRRAICAGRLQFRLHVARRWRWRTYVPAILDRRSLPVNRRKHVRFEKSLSETRARRSVHRRSDAR
jgi:hypothetical protein